MDRKAMKSMLATLRLDFAKVERMDPGGPVYKRLCDLLDSADDDALKEVHKADIKFVSGLAFNRMIRRGINPGAPKGGT